MTDTNPFASPTPVESDDPAPAGSVRQLPAWRRFLGFSAIGFAAIIYLASMRIVLLVASAEPGQYEGLFREETRNRVVVLPVFCAVVAIGGGFAALRRRGAIRTIGVAVVLLVLGELLAYVLLPQ